MFETFHYKIVNKGNYWECWVLLRITELFTFVLHGHPHFVNRQLKREHLSSRYVGNHNRNHYYYLHDYCSNKGSIDSIADNWPSIVGPAPNSEDDRQTNPVDWIHQNCPLSRAQHCPAVAKSWAEKLSLAQQLLTQLGRQWMEPRTGRIGRLKAEKPKKKSY